LFLYFFFQAEDGIRDRNVTGVQTCALPILTLSKNLSCFLIFLLLKQGIEGIFLAFNLIYQLLCTSFFFRNLIAVFPDLHICIFYCLVDFILLTQAFLL